MTVNQTEKSTALWVDRNQKMVAFRYLEGSERIEFPTHDAMIQYAAQLVSKGYRIM